MTSPIQTPTADLPPITISAQDAERLLRTARAGAAQNLAAADYLLREVERADVVDAALPTGLVTMGAEVAFRDELTGQERQATLVYPDEADVSAGKLSVLSPIGAALIGLSVGQSIQFQTPSGGWRPVTVLRVVAGG